MNDAPIAPTGQAARQVEPTPAEYVPVKALENLPKETRDVVSVIAGFFRSTSGPDPETAKIVAQTEMHEESCKLDGYRETLTARDKINARDHEFRKMRLIYETTKSLLVSVVAIGGIIVGLYLLVAKNNGTVGTPLLVACFMALLGGKSLFPKEKNKEVNDRFLLPALFA